MQTDPILKSVRVARAYMKSKLDGLTHDQWLTIPDGAMNNVLWNVGHIVLSHYRLLYRPSGGTVPLPPTWEAWFLAGTSPAQWGAVSPGKEEVLREFDAQVDRVEAEFHKGAFAQYKPFTLKSGFTLDTAAEALSFNVMHEGIHIGAVIALRQQLGVADAE